MLLKIGELASHINRLPSAIHFYTKEGLLKPDSFTRGGYRLYEKSKALKTIKEIERLQTNKRFTIAEIKSYLKNKQ
ncbi:MAG TPA: MerR family transcriptional regulator [bacterium]|jgi:DNA-binding transcriptional MerR regulator|nr:MerR family transcriptional regulator [bacterium]HOG37944.1 MerR family transcriptional regulator [bacterium]HQI03002.1 MerR family transcriptional regulator [bacterium]